MKPKIPLGRIVAFASLLFTGAILTSQGVAATVLAEDLTWYQTNPFAGGAAWSANTDPAFVGANNPGGNVLGNSNGSSVDTSIYGSFATQTLLGAGDAITFSFQARRTNVPTSTDFLSVGLGWDGGTPFTQDYFSPATPPTGDDAVKS